MKILNSPPFPTFPHRNEILEVLVGFVKGKKKKSQDFFLRYHLRLQLISKTASSIRMGYPFKKKWRTHPSPDPPCLTPRAGSGGQVRPPYPIPPILPLDALHSPRASPCIAPSLPHRKTRRLSVKLLIKIE
ncbi:hypothetical protein IIA15_05155 [candidate division TA06 bacterium]|nr:hypothetical protein [candidate division TA06 bacterium]